MGKVVNHVNSDTWASPEMNIATEQNSLVSNEVGIFWKDFGAICTIIASLTADLIDSILASKESRQSQTEAR